MSAAPNDASYPVDAVEQIATVVMNLVDIEREAAIRYAEEVGDRRELAEDLAGSLDLDEDDAWDEVSHLYGAFDEVDAWRAAHG